jgi:hypothetical protein
MAAVLAAVVRMIIIFAHRPSFDTGIARATRLIPLVFDRRKITPSSTVRISLPFFQSVAHLPDRITVNFVFVSQAGTLKTRSSAPFSQHLSRLRLCTFLVGKMLSFL